jgi:peroxiredoxin
MASKINARKYKSEFNISFPILIDDKTQVADSYGVWSHPVLRYIMGSM